MSNTNTNTNTQPTYEFIYNPPLTPAGDRDWRKEVRGWMRLRNSGRAPLDLNTIVVIDNLLDALDAARKERDDARQMERLVRGALGRSVEEARAPGAWRHIGNPNDRIP